MATKYQIINVKASKGTIEGNAFDNRMILCYSSEPGKYVICGPNTENLKMKTDDFNYAIRSHNYDVNEFEGKIMTPIFGRNDYITDFTLSDPDTGEVIGQ